MYPDSEINNIKLRFENRKGLSHLYEYTLPSVYLNEHQKEKKILEIFKSIGFENLCSKKILEIGGGSGQNILMFLRMGFVPENIFFNELLPDRFETANNRLPNKINMLPGDALILELGSEYFDIVYQSTVFTSILDEETKRVLAKKMWNWVKPGGGILWYDFIYNNPHNKDVQGIGIKKVRGLFPEGKFKIIRITLAPPLSRIITQISPALYNVFNLFPFLRTHILCWIKK